MPENTAKTATSATEGATPPATPERPPLQFPEFARVRDIRSRRRPVRVARLAARERPRVALRTASLLVLDALGIALAIWSALALKALVQGNFDLEDTISDTRHYWPIAFLVVALLFARAGLYGPRETRPGAARMFSSLAQATAILLVFALVSGAEFSSYWLFWGGLALGAVFLSALRYAYEAASGHLLGLIGYSPRTIVIGSAPRAAEIAAALQDGKPNGHRVVGWLPLGDSANGNGNGNGAGSHPPEIGSLAELPSRLALWGVEEAVIADPDLPQETAVRLISDCQAQGVRIRMVPSTVELLTETPRLEPGVAVPLLDVKPPAFRGFDFVIKRSFDFGLAFAGLVLFSPLLLAVAVLIRLTSRGPILHRSVRPGIGGRPFDCLKFRTMYADAEQRQEELEPLNEAEGPIFKIRDDPRTTPLGRFLRRNSIDELPQLINVLRGQMSLVGPRPLPLRDHARLEEWHHRRYNVLPGVTGLWQVSGRSDLTFDDMVRLDFLYIERWSVLLDLTILLKTVPAVIRRRGAY